MIDTRAVLKDVADRLRAAIPEVEVALTPERPQAWRLNHPRAALLVAYGGSRYGQPRDADLVVQERTLRVHVYIVARALHDAYGAVPLVDAAADALLGLRATNCGRLRLVSDRFVSEEAGIWTYELVFEAETLAIEDRELSAVPRLARVTADYGPEQETLP